jgi:hypothetical protein
VLLNIGEGFEIPLGSLWLDPHSKQWHRWLERWLVIRSHALAARQIKGLEQRLQKAEKALTQFASKPGTDTQLRSNIVVETDTETRGRGDAEKNDCTTYECNLV